MRLIPYYQGGTTQIKIKRRKKIRGNSNVSKAMDAELQRQQDKDTRYYNDNGTYVADTELREVGTTAKKRQNSTDRWSVSEQRWVQQPKEGKWEWNPETEQFEDLEQSAPVRDLTSTNFGKVDVQQNSSIQSRQPMVNLPPTEFVDVTSYTPNEEKNYPDHMDQKTREFFENDIFPRFMRTNPNATPEEIQKLHEVFNIPIRYYYTRATSDGGIVTGHQNGGDNSYSQSYFLGVPVKRENDPTYVEFNTSVNVARPTLVHEFTHGYRQGLLGNLRDSQFSKDRTQYSSGKPSSKDLWTGTEERWVDGSGYSDEEKDLLNKAYNLDGFSLKYPALYEKGTTNAEVRYRIWNRWRDEHNGQIPTIDELDDYIDDLYWNSTDIENLIRKANSYGKKMYNNGLDVNVVNALKYVAQNNNTPDNRVPTARFGKRIIKRYK